MADGELVHRARSAVGLGDVDQTALGLIRLSGGMNHGVFASTDASALVVKVFATGAGDEPAREWEALEALAGSGLAPTPVQFEPSEPAVVVMTRISGRSLPASALDETHAAAIGSAHRRIHQAEPDVQRHPSHDGVRAALAALRSNAAASFESHSNAVAAAWREAGAWLRTADVERCLSSARLCFSRGDPNLENYLWTDDGVVLIDFENSGYSDPVLEFADFAEHANNHALNEDFLFTLAAASGLTESDIGRVRDARRLMTCFWLVLITTRDRANLPTTITLDEQAHRTLQALDR